MAQHDLQCSACGRVYRDVQIPITQGARAYCAANYCHCVIGGTSTLEPIPAAHFSCFSDSERGSFAKTTIPVEDPSSPTGFRDVTIGSLADIRRLEKSSEEAERNGEGRRMIWRDYSQDATNKDKHTIADDPSLTPSKVTQQGAPVSVGRGERSNALAGEV